MSAALPLPKLLFSLSLIGALHAVQPVEAQIVGSISATPPTTSPSSSSAPITVSGVVLNASNGVPISRALVRINDRAMLTDHEGKFEFDQFTPVSSAMLEVRKPGFYFGQFMGPSSITLRADQMANPVVVRLSPEALITGTLTSQDGTPLPQIFLSAMRSTYNDGRQQWIPGGHGVTNSRGEFRLAVPPGDYRITTNFLARLQGSANAVLPLAYPAPGATGTSGGVHLASGTEQHLELHATVSRTYTVGVHLDSSPERGFPMLTARSNDGSTFPANIVRGGPGSSDEMQVALPSGTYTLIASLNRGESVEYGEATVTVANQNLSGVGIHLAPVAPIPIQVIVDTESTSDKAPPTVQQLVLSMQSEQAMPSLMGVGSFMPMMASGQDASFRLPPGVYRFSSHSLGQWYIKSASYGTTDLLQQEVTVTAGSAGSSPIVVTVSNQTGSLQGTVKQNGAPASAWIYVIPSGPSSVPVYTNRSGADGSFNFAYLPPGSYQAIAFEERYSFDSRNQDALNSFNTSLRSIVVSRGNKASVDLEVVPSTELNP